MRFLSGIIKATILSGFLFILFNCYILFAGEDRNDSRLAQTIIELAEDYSKQTMDNDIPLKFYLKNPAGKLIDVGLQFSTDGGKTWNPCTRKDYLSSTALQSSPDGYYNIITWDSRKDIGEHTADNVILKITCEDEKHYSKTIKIAAIDNRPFISLNTELLSVNENDGHITVSADISTTSSNTISVDFTTSDSTALSGKDYTTVKGQLIFNPGEMYKSITIPIKDDEISEPLKSFSVVISNPVNARIFSQGSITLALNDDDAWIVDIINPAATKSGIIPISYILKNKNGLPTDIKVEYFTEKTNKWIQCASAGDDDGVLNIPTSSTGTKHLFNWDSKADIQSNDEGAVNIRITALKDNTYDVSNEFKPIYKEKESKGIYKEQQSEIEEKKKEKLTPPLSADGANQLFEISIVNQEEKYPVKNMKLLFPTIIPEKQICTGDVLRFNVFNRTSGITFSKFVFDFDDGVRIETDTFDEIKTVRHCFFGKPYDVFNVKFEAIPVDKSSVRFSSSARVIISNYFLNAATLDPESRQFFSLGIQKNNRNNYVPYMENNITAIARGPECVTYIPDYAKVKKDKQPDSTDIFRKYFPSPGSFNEADDQSELLNPMRLSFVAQAWGWRRKSGDTDGKLPVINGIDQIYNPYSEENNVSEKSEYKFMERDFVTQKVDEVPKLETREVNYNDSSAIKFPELISYQYSSSSLKAPTSPYGRSSTVTGRNMDFHPATKLDKTAQNTIKPYYPGDGGFMAADCGYFLSERMQNSAEILTKTNSQGNVIPHRLTKLLSYGNYSPLDSHGYISDETFFALVKTINEMGDHGIKALFPLYLSPVSTTYCNKGILYGYPGFGDPSKVQPGLKNPGYVAKGAFFTSTDVREYQKSFIRDLFKKFYYGNSASPEWSVSLEEARRAYRNILAITPLHETKTVNFAGHDTPMIFEYTTKIGSTTSESPVNLKILDAYKKARTIPISKNATEFFCGELNYNASNAPSPTGTDKPFLELPPRLSGIKFYRWTNEAWQPAFVLNCGDNNSVFTVDGYPVINDQTATSLPPQSFKQQNITINGTQYSFFWKCNIGKAIKSTPGGYDPSLGNDYLVYDYQIEGIGSSCLIDYSFYGNVFDVLKRSDNALQIDLMFIESDQKARQGDRLMKAFCTYSGVPLQQVYGTPPPSASLVFNGFYEITNASHLLPDNISAAETDSLSGINPFAFTLINYQQNNFPYIGDFLKPQSQVRIRRGNSSGDSIRDSLTGQYYVRSSKGNIIDIYASTIVLFLGDTSGSQALTGKDSRFISKKEYMKETMSGSRFKIPDHIKPGRTLLTKTRMWTNQNENYASYEDVGAWIGDIISTIRTEEEKYQKMSGITDYQHLPVFVANENGSGWDPFTLMKYVVAVPGAEYPALFNSNNDYGGGNRYAYTATDSIDNVNVSTQFYRGDHAMRQTFFFNYFDSYLWDGTAYSNKWRAYSHEEGSSGLNIRPDPQNVEQEGDIAHFHVRDRLWLKLFSRTPGHAASHNDDVVGELEEIRMAKLIRDKYEYDKIRKDNNTLFPSIMVDYSKAWWKYLQYFWYIPNESFGARFNIMACLSAINLFALDNWVDTSLALQIDSLSSFSLSRWFSESSAEWLDEDVIVSTTTPVTGTPEGFAEICSSSLFPQSMSMAIAINFGSRFSGGKVNFSDKNGNDQRILYPDNSSSLHFQSKMWAGQSIGAGEPDKDTDYIGADGKAEVLFAYIRPANNKCRFVQSSSKPHDFYSEFPYQSNMQLWRNIDINNKSGLNTDNKWSLMQDYNSYVTSYCDNEYVRKPAIVDAQSTLKFYINTKKFKSGKYIYSLISLDKMKEKLHLMSKYEYALNQNEFEAGDKEQPYNIEKNLNMDNVFGNIYINVAANFPASSTPGDTFPNPGDYQTWMVNNSPIILEGVFTAASDSVAIPLNVTPLYFMEADPKNDSNGDGFLDDAAYNKPMTDFILVVKKQ